MASLLGCIADDFTGATDLAGMLVRAGMRTVQTIGVPAAAPDGVDAVVVALKSRTVPAREAVDLSLAALRWLRRAGASRFYFKYCSTFDSTDEGNIGPVADALLDELGTPFTIACPAFPENGRTVFNGHLFVGEALLSESGMRDHPLTPMTDPNLVRVLQRQTRRRVGLVGHAAVSEGAPRIRERFDELRRAGVGIAIVDATSNADLLRIAAASADLPLVTAASGLALGLAPAYAEAGLFRPAGRADALPPASGFAAILAGSCSMATNGQVAAALKAGMPALRLDPVRLAEDGGAVASALAWAAPLLPRGPVLLYSTAEPERVREAQDRLGRDRAGAVVEGALAAIARGLVERGVGRLIVAGGETSGAVVNALGIGALRIGPEIVPGVPWTSAVDGLSPPRTAPVEPLGTGGGASPPRTAPVEPLGTGGGRPLSLALKSGNFGGPAFFLDAWSKLP